VAGLRFIFDPRFTEAVFHHPGHRVDGKRLRPFSPWHKLQLEYHNSPLIGGGDVTPADVVLAVAICRSQYPHPGRVRERGRIGRFFWMLRAERMDLVREVRAFQRYQADYYSPPKLWETPRPKGAPPPRHDMDDSIELVTAYMAAYGGTREAAWNMPIGEMIWMNICTARREGGNVMVWTPRDEREYQAHLKREAKIIADLATKFAAEENLEPAAAQERAKRHYWKTVNANKLKGGFSI